MSFYDSRNSGIGTIRGYKYLTRVQITTPWEDHPCAGTLYKLIEYGTKFAITEFDISDMIGWGKRTIQNQINQILLKSCLKQSISYIKIRQGGEQRRAWKLDSKYSDGCFTTIHELMLGSHYMSKYNGMTSPEFVVNNLLKEMFKNQWEYTGKVILPNRIGQCYPDFTNIDTNSIIEVFGDYWHGPLITVKNPESHERDKIEHYKKHNFKCLVIWEKELKNIDCVKEKILKFHESINNR